MQKFHFFYDMNEFYFFFEPSYDDFKILINYPAASYGVSNGKNTAWVRSKLRGIAPCKGLNLAIMLIYNDKSISLREGASYERDTRDSLHPER
jgi:hypothetical protein